MVASFFKSRRVISIVVVTLLIVAFTISYLAGILGTRPMDEPQKSAMTLEYSTFFGGGNDDDAYRLVLDSENNIIIAGSTTSSNFPKIANFSSAKSPPGVRNGFVTKFSPSGNILFSTLLGGSGMDTIRGLAVNKQGNIIVAGDTMSPDFPITDDAIDKTLNGTQADFVSPFCCGDGFVSIISQDFSELLYSSYLGGNGVEGHVTLELDSNDNIVVTGFTNSNDFQVTYNAIQSELGGLEDLFLSIFNPGGNETIYSSYFGGSGQDFSFISLEIDGMDNIYISASTTSTDLPVTADAMTPTHQGGWDGFVVKFGNRGSTLEYSTFIGGSDDDSGFALAVGPNHDMYIIGSTLSKDFPLSDNAFQPEHAGGFCWQTPIVPLCGDGYLIHLSNAGELLASSYLGGSSFDMPLVIRRDNNGNIMITGVTGSPDFPTTKNAYQREKVQGTDISITIISTSDFSLVFSSIFGGSRTEFSNDMQIDSQGMVYITGWTNSPDFPTTNNVLYVDPPGNQDIYLTKFILDLEA